MKLVKEIKSKKGVIHFKRWEVLSTRWFNVFLHLILEKDHDLHCHSHSWSFISIILKGSYAEMREDRSIKKRSFLSVAFLPAKAFHKILKVFKPTWSLVITGPYKDPWGYCTEIGWVEHNRYRILKRQGFWNK